MRLRDILPTAYSENKNKKHLFNFKTFLLQTFDIFDYAINKVAFTIKASDKELLLIFGLFPCGIQFCAFINDFILHAVLNDSLLNTQLGIIKSAVEPV